MQHEIQHWRIVLSLNRNIFGWITLEAIWGEGKVIHNKGPMLTVRKERVRQKMTASKS
jgi:hypothetical protein